MSAPPRESSTGGGLRHPQYSRLGVPSPSSSSSSLVDLAASSNDGNGGGGSFPPAAPVGGQAHLSSLMHDPSTQTTLYDPEPPTLPYAGGRATSSRYSLDRTSYYDDDDDDPLKNNRGQSTPSSVNNHRDYYDGVESEDNKGLLTPHQSEGGYLSEEERRFSTVGSLGPGGGGGGSFPNPRFSSYNSSQVALMRSQTSADAWRRRQQVTPNRARTVKVAMKQGIFVNDYPVPTAVKRANVGSSYGGQGEHKEFTHLRYTAATCDPDDFTAEAGYKLRQSMYGRKTDLCVAITYYNEDKILLARSLHHVMTNIRDMVKGRFSEFRKMTEKDGGESGAGQGWKRIVCTLVFDGIEPANKVALDVLATVGIFQDGIMKKSIDGKETMCHIFEYTTQISITPKPALIQPLGNDPENLVPVQMIFCFKQKNSKKINSHRWLFNAVGRMLDPEVFVLLDAGTKPGPRAIYYLWEAFHHKKYLGGACGEITAQLNKGKKLINFLVAAQNFEYKTSNILDKPTEHVFGYISVLPGAFSAYRWKAIQGRPLEQYFHGDHTLAARLGKKGIEGMSIFRKNMFLAEDRILCFELLAKAKERWVLGYVKPSKAETDVPESAAEFISQRRRWLNGSFAATVYALAHFGRVYRSRHGVLRQLLLHIQLVYSVVNQVMAWFAPGNFWATFSIIIEIVADDLFDPEKIPGADPKTISCWSGSPIQRGKIDHNYVQTGNTVLEWIYALFVAIQVVLALGNRPKSERGLYTLSFWVFGICSAYLIFCTVILTIKAFCPVGELLDKSGGNIASVFLSSTYGPIFAGLIGTFGVYIITGILAGDPWHVLTSLLPYLLVSPSFSNILNVYAFCNLHDVSWGTKGSDKAESLPSVVSKAGGAKEGEDREAEALIESQDALDHKFKETVHRAVAPFELEDEASKPNIDDENKTFRTRFFLVWLITNLGIVATVNYINQQSRTIYFQVVLWIVFGLSAVRFMGFMWYLGGEWLFRLARLCARARR